MDFIANADYEEKDRTPIRLATGDEVTVGEPDRAWPGWVWATDAEGHSGYVPEEFLSRDEENRLVMNEAYDPTVLTVARGDRLTSLRQIHGWHWCQREDGTTGWVAGYLLRPL